ncbi:MAG TPA: nucleotidyltransferase domain-containing protein [Catalimonadaceae bacterium]|jgi:predicted nucleotidyltransferase|nr:nucleotidyltransferase domain-containing protein [Catalimonadaceae bacterium]
MKFGLTDADWDLLTQTFCQRPEIRKVVLFGSRAKGNFRVGSDIDLAFYLNPALTFTQWLELQTELDSLDFLQKIDALDIDKIKNPELIAHIDRIGKVVFER